MTPTESFFEAIAKRGVVDETNWTTSCYKTIQSKPLPMPPKPKRKEE